MNQWLISHGGYVDRDLIAWSTVGALGSMKLFSVTETLTVAHLREYIEKCYPIVVNVREGSHWVLITGYDNTNSQLYYVNDPGFSSVAYDLSGMKNFVVYSP